MIEMDADELLDRVAQQCEDAGIEFTEEHRKFLRELLYVISLQQRLAERTGEPVGDVLELLRAWGDRLDRVMADDPAELFDCLKSLGQTIEMADTTDGSSLSPQTREQVSQLRAEAWNCWTITKPRSGPRRRGSFYGSER
jgi:hypothetical protein